MVILGILFFLFTIKAQASTKVNFNLGYWPSSGNLNWKISGDTWLEMNGNYDYSEFASELDYDTNSNMAIFGLELEPIDWFSFDFSYGTGDIQSGTCTDTDWFYDYTDYFYDYSSDPVFQTQNPSSGDTYFYNANLNFTKSFEEARLTGFVKKIERIKIGLFLGYEYSKVSMDMIDPITILIWGWQDYHITESEGLNSTYDLTFEGIRVGTKMEVVLTEQLAIKGSIAYLPSLDVKGEGYWNLRDLYFYQSGQGHGTDAEISLHYTPFSKLFLSLGYRAKNYRQSGGTDRIAGETAISNWDKATFIQQGIFFNAIIKL
jgi:hypothetical protein